MYICVYIYIYLSIDNIICVKTDLPLRQNMDPIKLVLKICILCVLFVMTICMSYDF